MQIYILVIAFILHEYMYVNIDKETRKISQIRLPFFNKNTDLHPFVLKRLCCIIADR